MDQEYSEIYNPLIHNNNPTMQLIGYNIQYLTDNNFYKYKLDELEKENKYLHKDNCKLVNELNELKYDHKHILSKYDELKSGTKRKSNIEIVEPNIIKKRRKSKYSFKEDEIKRIFNNINSIQDIINLKEYGNKIYHDIKLVKLINIIPPLEKLNNMVGLNNIKKQIFDHILYFIQDLNQDEMYHTVISGPPGVGKTEVGKIMGSIYLGLGILKNDTFRIVKRSELVGKYLGHTAAQTQEIIDECEGGVMFIDEAYSLGNEEKRDSFSKECLDTINQNLTENKGKFMCIIAGYTDALNKCFFSYNEGLKRRFPFWYDIKGYNAEELKEIFIRKVKISGWSLKEDINSDFFDKKFEFYGGDIENFTFLARMAYSKRIFKESDQENKILILDDLKEGYLKFQESKNKLEEKIDPPPFGMYN